MLPLLKRNKKRIIFTAIASLLCAGCLAAAASVSFIKVNLMLYVDGNAIGAVESAEDVEAVRRSVAEDIALVSYAPSGAVCDISYGFAEGKKAGSVLTEGDIYRALYISSLKRYTSAYGLYVNGELMAANTDAGVISNAVASVREAAQEGMELEVELTGELEVRSMYYPTALLRAGNEIEAVLTSNADGLYKTVSHDPASVISVNIDASEDEKKFLGSGGEVLSSETMSDGVVSVTIKVTESVPYTTEYNRNDELYIGTYEKIQDGADGQKQVIYSIIYEDGVPTSREKISEEITLPAIPKVIDEGTKAVPVTATKDKYEWPIKARYTLTDTFGRRTVYGKVSYHYAIDIATSSGTPVYAANGGVVIKAEYNGSYGNYVVIKHDNGHETLYAHMRKAAIVSVGDRVYQGQQIGEVGMTGYATGPHLHFEIHINGEKVDPLKYLP